MKHPFSKSRGFTLIELLVVITILSLLVSILVPSLTKAKALARKSICLSNVRYLAVTNHLYAQENEEFLVIAAEDIWWPNLKRWHGQRDNVNEAFDPQRGPMMAHMGVEGLKECPSFRKEFDFSDEAGQEKAFEAGCGGYGYNATYLGGRNDLYGMGSQASASSAKLDEITQAAQTVMFTDCAYVTMIDGVDCKIAYSFCETPFWQFEANAPPSDMHPDPSIDFRHLGQTNVAWADGHADSRDLDFTVSYQTHSLISGDEAKQQGIGWFGPESNEWFDLE